MPASSLPELVLALINNSNFHFVIPFDNILAASVIAMSLVYNSLRPETVVIHIITNRVTYSMMQAWFSLHPLSPVMIEVKALHHFDWFAKGKVPFLEATKKDKKIRAPFRGDSSTIVAHNTEKPYVIAAKLQALSLNLIARELIGSGFVDVSESNKVMFLDDDSSAKSITAI
ncbi:hypothetical protein L1887_38585 [Cichorium endivia]|nr:hypothetical protein L1887_38585 [Cichorium endivia]